MTREELEKKVVDLETQLNAQGAALQETEALKKLVIKRETELNKLASAHGDLLKGLESLTNTHLIMNGYIIQEIQKK